MYATGSLYHGRNTVASNMSDLMVYDKFMALMKASRHVTRATVEGDGSVTSMRKVRQM